MNNKLTKQEKIDLIVKHFKQNSRMPLKELSKKTGLTVDTINNYIGYVREKYIFTIIEKSSKFYEYLQFHGWFKGE